MKRVDVKNMYLTFIHGTLIQRGFFFFGLNMSYIDLKTHAQLHKLSITINNHN